MDPDESPAPPPPDPAVTERRRLVQAAARGLRQAGLPVRQVDLAEALAARDDAVEETIHAAVMARLQGAGSLAAAFEEAANDLRGQDGADPTLEDVGHAAMAAAAAFGLDERDAQRFTRNMVEAERGQRQRRRDQARQAREAAAAERARLTTWESTLVTLPVAAETLGVPVEALERWVQEGKVPTAKRPGFRRRGRAKPAALFDPAVLAKVREHVAKWQAPAPAAPRQEDRRPAPRHRIARVANETIAEVAGLHDFAAHYRTARALHRKFTVITGPTNSGKTHEALNRVAAGQSGIALGPLRLLAWEMREALASRGIQASLLTGEERVVVPDSQFVCATVEMCPFTTPVDVAIVDEAQMLYDAERGAAWSAALFGVPARDVVVLGSPDCVPMVRRIAELCGDTVEEISLARKSPLVAARDPVALRDLQKGDALIAFSRREVLELRATLQQHNRRVACVYGALSPEVRRAEAKRFRDHEADILVATDAIGLGLNIGPLQRVVFSTLTKWDGKARRMLSAPEIKQIGGRAGRFGHHEVGEVAVLVGAGRPEQIALALAAPARAPADLRPLVAPDADIVAAVAAELQTTSLFATLQRIRYAVLRADDQNYRLADLSVQIEIAEALDGIPLPLLTRWTYALCPVDLRDNGVRRLQRWALDHADGHAIRVPKAGRLPRVQEASADELGRAETTYRRLVAWRWMAQRFPEAYPDLTDALAESERVNEWIEGVLKSRPHRTAPARPNTAKPGRKAPSTSRRGR